MDILNKKYDLIFGLGEACSCTQIIRGSRLQFESYPFDWLSGTNLTGRTKILCDNFETWFNKEDLMFIGTRQHPEPRNIYKNKKTDITFNHDFSLDGSFDDEYPKIKEKYDRRAKRLIQRIENSKKVLAVYLQVTYNQNQEDNSDLEKAFEYLKNRFKNTDITLLYIFNNKNIDFKHKKITVISDKIVKIEFNYERPLEGQPEAVKVKELRSIFKRINLSNKFLTPKNIISKTLYKIRTIFLPK